MRRTRRSQCTLRAKALSMEALPIAEVKISRARSRMRANCCTRSGAISDMLEDYRERQYNPRHASEDQSRRQETRVRACLSGSAKDSEAIRREAASDQRPPWRVYERVEVDPISGETGDVCGHHEQELRGISSLSGVHVSGPAERHFS